ncbi:MAG: SH3 beta-barrel fold-containing protein [Lachnospiraceae bacterium]|nr:SH3 beta-barrel fold-containing protein [Lachnospiraceae bacterium]
MDYINTSTSFLKEELKEHVITFEYKKKNGDIRTAKGTLCQSIIDELIQPQEIEFIKLEKKYVDIIIKEHDYEDLIQYALENDVDCCGEEDGYYLFLPKPRKKIKNMNNISYFDVDKKEWRSFLSENYFGLITIEN